MYREHTVAAVIPAYNEEGFVGDVIDDLPSIIDRAYVVDDGSTDGTWAEIERHASARNAQHDGRYDELVFPVRHETNRGVGGAIKTGYRQAREEGIDMTVVLGGDGQMNPHEIPRYLDPIVDGVADYTKGNRFSRPADYQEMPRFRLVGNVVLSYLTKIASGYWETMDSQNGYTAISLEALDRTDIEGMYEYYGYCNDLLVRLNVADVRVGDVPRSSEYAYSDGWKSHIDYGEYIPRVSVMLFRGFLRRLGQKYLLGGYNPLVFLYLVGTGLLAAGTASLVGDAVRGDGNTGSRSTSMIGGLLLVLYAGVLDHQENAHLEVQLPPEAESSPSEAPVDGSDPDRGMPSQGPQLRTNGATKDETPTGSGDTQ